MRFATYIFDAKSNQDPAFLSFLHFARPVPSEMKITRISRWRILGRPGGMRGGAGGRLDGGLRSADLRFAISDLCFQSDTPALGFRPGAADSIAPRILPGRVDGCNDASI